MIFHLVLIYLTISEESEEVYEEAEKVLEEIGLRITRGVIISWRDKDDLESRLLRLKDIIIRRLEEGYENIELIYSIVELSEEQFKSVRNLVVKKLETLCNNMIERVERLIDDIRSMPPRQVRKFRKTLQEIEDSFRKIVEFHKVFDVRHSIFDRLNKLMSELRAEFYRRLK